MEKTELKILKDIIHRIEHDYNFNEYIDYYIDDDDILDYDCIDDIIDYIRALNEDGLITTVEIIYYSNAINYLANNDASLCDSMQLAIEYGYSIEQINSELLASLHATRQNEEDFGTFLDRLKHDYALQKNE